VRALEAAGTVIAPVTLHAGLGAFEPVETEDLSKHRVVTEAFAVPEATAARVNAAIDAGHTVTACGTTVLRATESALTASRRLKAASGWTDRFIYPPHEFNVARRLLTNFQRPRSTRMMAVGAFVGMDLLRHAYAEAVAHEYRLFSFGDAMLVV
jgi:S-adenosylmethionine:tRNA ribosyltransferase-isomerase